jgi:hypothetical protein
METFAFQRDSKPVQEDTPNYGDPDRWREVTVDLGNRTLSDVWTLLSNIHATFRTGDPDYLYGLGQNSNSYVNTLLWMIGVDLSDHLSAVRPPDVTGMSQADANYYSSFGLMLAEIEDLMSPFPASDRNLLTDGYGAFGRPLDFDIVGLLGTARGDFIRTGDGDDSITRTGSVRVLLVHMPGITERALMDLDAAGMQDIRSRTDDAFGDQVQNFVFGDQYDAIIMNPEA